jgi:hypothetical protein
LEGRSPDQASPANLLGDTAELFPDLLYGRQIFRRAISAAVVVVPAVPHGRGKLLRTENVALLPLEEMSFIWSRCPEASTMIEYGPPPGSRFVIAL